MSLWLWIAIGIVSYMVFLAAVLGICRAAAHGDKIDREIYERWANTPRSHRPAA